MMFIRRPLTIAIIFYLLVTILFNYQLFCNVFFSCTQSHPSDGIITEYLTETSWHNFKTGQNPYAFEQKLFYPFYSTSALADPGNAHFIFFGLLRTVSSSHQALLVIVCINLLLNYLVMYALLRKLNIRFPFALIGGFMYGAMPFVSYRVLNHYTYTPLFLFPLLFICIYMLFTSTARNAKVFYAIILSIIGAYLLLSNFYYFISVVIAGAFLYSYSFVYYGKKMREFIGKNILYISLSALLFLYLLKPWLHAVFLYNTLYSTSKMQGFGGAWVLSSDLINVFLPSQYNPLYAFIFSKLASVGSIFSKLQIMFLSGYSRNAYAGIVLLISIPSIILLRKKVSTSISKLSIMYLSVSLFFLLLCFGPFLQIFNRWFVSFEDVQVVLPMPFLLLHYVPGMDTLRAPARFAPLYIFFLVLAAAYFWNDYYEKISLKWRYISVSIVFCIVLLDQSYIMPRSSDEYMSAIPRKIYDIVERDEAKGAVLEIPFAVRDGFSYRGNVKAVTPMRGVLSHGRPIIGGYIARVAPEIFSYYDSLPFISILASLIDEGNGDNSNTHNKLDSVTLTSKEISQELEMLNITHVIIQQDKEYSNKLHTLFIRSGYKQRTTDLNYILYSKPSTKKEFTRIDFVSSHVPAFFIAIKDANKKKSAYQFTTQAKLFVNTKTPKKWLVIKAAQANNEQFDIYVNGVYIKSLPIENAKKRYTIPITLQQTGVQMIDIIAQNQKVQSQASLYAVEVQ